MTTTACIRCHRDLHPQETGRQACQPCQTRTDSHLATLPDLYTQLDTHTTTSRSGIPTLTRTRRAHSPVPINVTALDLATEIPEALAAWVADWAAHGYADPTARGIHETVRTLRFNLDQAAAEHPAFADFAAKIARLHRACERATGSQAAERAVRVSCPCGTVLAVTVSTSGADCRGCGTEYGRRQVLGLPLAARAAA